MGRLRLLPLLLPPLLGLLLGLLPAGLTADTPPAATGSPRQPWPGSSEALARRSPFNRPESFPLAQRPRAGAYRPHADWIGRLILPSATEQTARAGDWVWLEVQQSPAGSGLTPGDRLRLSWSDRPRLQALVASVSTPVRLGEAARRSMAAGNVVPTRLNGRRVGPLQSLAGSRPVDDVVVSLEGVETAGGGELRISLPPVQISGRWTALVTVLGPAGRPGDPDLFRVQHYDREGGLFSGSEETIRIPRQPPDRFGRRFFDADGIADTALNSDGWYVHGAPTADGVFTVQAIEPRALSRLTPWQMVEGIQASRRWLRRLTWGMPGQERGRIEKASLRGRHGVTDPGWRRGDRALVIHGFGGIGGPGGEPVTGFTVTGHFAFGEARVVADPFTGEDRFAIRYHQIYANNPNGIIAGIQDWSAFSGDLQRGWLGTRPIVDVAVRLENGRFSRAVLDELELQAEIISARYRSGDGRGVAEVTPASSCVQDSGQALWITLDQLRRQPALAELQPAQRQELARLARSLHAHITPFGIVRHDWRHNAGVIAAAVAAGERGQVAPQGDYHSSQGPAAVLLSWRSMLPRQAHDDLSQAFARQGLPLWVLRTSLIPGTDPSLEPVAPTLLFGSIPPLARLLERLSQALSTDAWRQTLPLTLLLLGVQAGVAIPLAARSGLINAADRWRPGRGWLRRAAGLLVMPAMAEELIFRVALLPQPDEGMGLARSAGWLTLSVLAFVAYHPLAGTCWYPAGRRLFRRPDFLAQCALLGLLCGLAYLASGCLWSAVAIHWITVVLWLEWLGGRRQLGSPAGSGPQEART
jgi:predicted Abi (CAAX) family protease